MTRAALILNAALLTTACNSASTPPAAPAETAPAPTTVELSATAQANAGVTVEAVASVMRSAQITAPGRITVDEGRTARVGSLQEALVLTTPVQVGDRVRPRQLLATMHGHAMHDAWAGYRTAVAERRRVENQLAYAITAHERAQRLYQDKALALQEVQRTEVERVSAAEALEIAKAEILRSLEELEHVGVVVPEGGGEPAPSADADEQIPVRTPLGGTVLEKLVTPGTTVTPGTPMFVVSDLSVVWAEAEVDESLTSQLQRGRSVAVTVPAYPDDAFDGTITFVADTVNPTTRRLVVRSTILNRDGRLKPEMLATLVIGQGAARPVVIVPAGAVQTIDGSTVVFVVEGTGRFAPRTVQLGRQDGGTVEVLSGLTDGERIAVTGSFVLKSELAKRASGGQ